MEDSLFKDSKTGPLHLTHSEGAEGSVYTPSPDLSRCLLVEGTTGDNVHVVMVGKTCPPAVCSCLGLLLLAGVLAWL